MGEDEEEGTGKDATAPPIAGSNDQDTLAMAENQYYLEFNSGIYYSLRCVAFGFNL